MLATVANTRNNRVSVTIHNKDIQQWPFNHRGVVTFDDVHELGTILGDLAKVTFYVSSNIFLEEIATNNLLAGQLVVRINHLCSVNDLLEPGCSYKTIRNVVGVTQISNSSG